MTKTNYTPAEQAAIDQILPRIRPKATATWSNRGQSSLGTETDDTFKSSVANVGWTEDKIAEALSGGGGTGVARSLIIINGSINPIPTTGTDDSDPVVTTRVTYEYDLAGTKYYRILVPGVKEIFRKTNPNTGEISFEHLYFITT